MFFLFRTFKKEKEWSLWTFVHYVLVCVASTVTPVQACKQAMKLDCLCMFPLYLAVFAWYVYVRYVT